MTEVRQTKMVDGLRVPSTRALPAGGYLIKNLVNAHRRYPDVVRLRMGVAEMYLVTNPGMIQEILVTKQRSFIKGEYLQHTKRVFGEGLLTSEGDFHHRQRRLVQPAFHHGRVDAYSKVMTGYAARTMAGWRDGLVCDIHQEMMKTTMSIVAKCLFDADVESDSKAIAEDLTTTIEYFGRLASPLSGLLRRLPSNRKYEKAAERIDGVVYGLIEKRRREGANDNGDLMSMLLQTKDVEGHQMTDRQLRDEVLILFAAGHETTANALTWTWYLLSQNPQVEERLHEEVDGLLSGDPRELEAQDMSRLPYTTKVLTESMRIYPPAWILVRKALEDCAIGGYRLPAGADIVVSPYVNHHDPAFFSDPERFEPERWTTEMEKNLPRFAYFPFGGGPRSCVGEPFAWMEGVLLLAAISRRWSMRHVEGHKVEMLPRITLRPRYGMKMQLKARLA